MAWVKKCAGCGAINNPSEVVCMSCGVMLPAQKTESVIEPPKPSIDALRALSGNKGYQPPPADKKIITPDDVVGVSGEVFIVDQPISVRVVEFDMPFLSMVWVSAKFIMAALPALIVAIVIMVSIFAALGAVFSPFRGLSG